MRSRPRGFLPDQDGRLISASDESRVFFQPVRGIDDVADLVENGTELSQALHRVHPWGCSNARRRVEAAKDGGAQVPRRPVRWQISRGRRSFVDVVLKAVAAATGRVWQRRRRSVRRTNRLDDPTARRGAVGGVAVFAGRSTRRLPRRLAFGEQSCLRAGVAGERRRKLVGAR